MNQRAMGESDAKAWASFGWWKEKAQVQNDQVKDVAAISTIHVKQLERLVSLLCC